MSLETSTAIGTLLALATIAGACGGSEASFSPAAPSGVGSTQGQAGASISGRVTSSTSTISSAPSGDGWATMTNSGINVTVVGTSINAVTDNSGLFALNHVPAGVVQLKFSGRGANAQVTLNGVGNGDRIEISVTLNGNAASVDSDQRSNTFPATGGGNTPPAGGGGNTPPAGGGGNQPPTNSGGNNSMRGTVASLSGSCPAITFSLGPNVPPVRTDASTRFDGGCSRVRNGVRVEVEAIFDTAGRNLAKRITIDD